MGQELSQCFDTSPEANASRACESVLAESNRQDLSVIKLLLLGAGGCGKTTLFKQMKIIYNSNGYTKEELEKQKDIVRRNILEIFQLCIQYAEQKELGLEETVRFTCLLFFTNYLVFKNLFFFVKTIAYSPNLLTIQLWFMQIVSITPFDQFFSKLNHLLLLFSIFFRNSLQS